MKLLPLALLLSLTFAPVSTQAQQVNTYGVCRQYREVYTPGYNDQYGNYVSGRVYTQSYIVPCDGSVATYVQPPQQQYYQRQRVCNPAAGAALGYGLATALSGQTGYNYNSNYTRNRNSGSYNYSYGNKRSNSWGIFGAGIGSILFGC